MFRTSAMVATTVTALASFASTGYAQDPGPETGTVSIGSFTHGGSACPAGSVAANISPDATALTIIFDNWVVEMDDTPAPVVTRQCRLDMKLVAPAGWRYAILGLDYRGFADLEAGARAEQTASYRFNGGAVGQLNPMLLTGPLSTDYINSTEIALTNLPWSSCGGDMTLTIDTSSKIDVSAPNVAREINLSSGGNRYAEQDLGVPISSMEVIRRDSAAQCKVNVGYGFSGTKAWVNKGCRALFRITAPGQPPLPKPRGLLTVDSIDGELRQNYGIAWQQCSPGRWVQAPKVGGNCANVCRGAGLRLGRDSGGAVCASGEARPSSVIGRATFAHGCWGSCTSMGTIPTSEQGPFCYAPGQKKDADRTDRTVACYCY